MSIKLAVLMTVFNRREETFRCLDSFFVVADAVNDLSAKVYLIDAGSDRTGIDAQSRWSDVVALSAGSDTYWASGMRASWENAKEDQFDYYMWLNNDVVLLPHWYSDLFKDGVLNPQREGCVIVGACADPATSAHTYGGFRLMPGPNPLKFKVIETDGTYQSCDTLNGNIVVIPSQTDTRIGGFPRHYKHNLADLAYGLTAKSRGVSMLLTPRPVGLCPRNAPQPLAPGIVERVRTASHVKNYPLRQWARFCLTYGGARGVLSIIRPYIRASIGNRPAAISGNRI